MKNYIIPFMAIILVFGTISSCKKGDFANYKAYTPDLDPRTLNYFFKAGSYWVYQDSATGAIDSQWVISYTYMLKQLDSASLNQTGGGGLPSQPYCGPFYYDNLTMTAIDLKNAVMDTLVYYGSNGMTLDPISPDALTGEVIFTLTPGTSIPRLSFLGSVNTFTQNGMNFSNVQVFQSQYSPLYSYYFTCNTDLYFCSGFGIIKKIEHTSGGDRVWQLERFHLL